MPNTFDAGQDWIDPTDLELRIIALELTIEKISRHVKSAEACGDDRSKIDAFNQVKKLVL